jgi:uncharacterized protein
MRPSEALAAHREEALAIIAKYPVSNPRIFGSVARGEDVEGSDLDIIVHPENSVTYFDLARLTLELEALLNCKIDLGEDIAVKEYVRKNIFSDARPL